MPTHFPPGTIVLALASVLGALAPSALLLSTARVAKTWGVAVLAYGLGLESKVSRRVSGYPRTLRNAFLVATLSPTNRKRSQPAVRTF